MATAVLSNTPGTINLCDTTTGWSGDTFALEPDIKVQGTNSVACAMTNNGVNNIQTTANFSAVNQHIRVWVNLAFVGNIDTKANNGIQIEVVSGSGTALYTVDGAGAGEYAGGWVNYVIYTGDTPTSGSVPSGTCTAVGLTVNTTSKPRNVPANCWVDAWRYGDGYTVTGGTNGDEIDWSHVAALDAAAAYGVITRIDDVYFFAGKVIVGSGATTTYFSSGQKVQFRDLPVSTTLYGVDFAGSGCNVSISGGAYGAAGTQNYTFDTSDANLNAFTMTGVQFSKAGLITFRSGQSITNCVFDNCGQVDPSSSTFQNNTLSNYTGPDAALLYPIDDSNISDIALISAGTGYGVELQEDGTTTVLLDGFTFDGYGASDTTNAGCVHTGTSSFDLTYNADVPTVNPTSRVTVTVTATLSVVINQTGCDVVILAAGTSTVLDSVDSQPGTTFQYTYSTAQDVDIGVIKPGYVVNYTYGYTLSGSNQTLNVTLRVDRNYQP